MTWEHLAAFPYTEEGRRRRSSNLTAARLGVWLERNDLVGASLWKELENHPVPAHWVGVLFLFFLLGDRWLPHLVTGQENFL